MLFYIYYSIGLIEFSMIIPKPLILEKKYVKNITENDLSDSFSLYHSDFLDVGRTL